MPTLETLLSFTRLPLKWWAILTVVAGLLLFGPETIQGRVLGDTPDARIEIPLTIGFLLGTCVVAWAAGEALWGWRRRSVRERRYREHVHEALGSLDALEQAVLREFYHCGVDALELPVSHPSVAGLLKKGLLEQAGSLGRASLGGLGRRVRSREVTPSGVTPRPRGFPRRARECPPVLTRGAPARSERPRDRGHASAWSSARRDVEDQKW